MVPFQRPLQFGGLAAGEFDCARRHPPEQVEYGLGGAGTAVGGNPGRVVLVTQDPGAFGAAPCYAQHQLPGVVFTSQSPPQGGLQDAAAQVTVRQVLQDRLARGVGQLDQPTLLPAGPGRPPGGGDPVLIESGQFRGIGDQHRRGVAALHQGLFEGHRQSRQFHVQLPQTLLCVVVEQDPGTFELADVLVQPVTVLIIQAHLRRLGPGAERHQAIVEAPVQQDCVAVFGQFRGQGRLDGITLLVGVGGLRHPERRTGAVQRHRAELPGRDGVFHIGWLGAGGDRLQGGPLLGKTSLQRLLELYIGQVRVVGDLEGQRRGGQQRIHGPIQPRVESPGLKHGRGTEWPSRYACTHPADATPSWWGSRWCWPRWQG